MKKTFLSVLSAIILMAGIQLSAHAVTVELISVGSSQARSGVYAGLYELSFDGTTTIAAMCDDFNTHVSIGDVWTAEIYTYADIQSGAPVKFASSGIERYSQAGYLFSLLGGATLSEQADINVAVWNIMTPGSIAMNVVAQNYYDLATSGAYDGFNFTGIMDVLTPNPPNASQEDLIPSAVPIPTAAWLLSSGLLGMVGVARRKS